MVTYLENCGSALEHQHASLSFCDMYKKLLILYFDFIKDSQNLYQPASNNGLKTKKWDHYLF